MSEIVNTFTLDDSGSITPMDREDFYTEQIKSFKETGKPTRSVEVIHILIFNTRGDLMLQKRSPDKSQNPGLIDKSLGGHIVHGDTSDYTVMMETVQELRTPSFVLKDDSTFKRTFEALQTYTDVISVTLHSITEVNTVAREIKGEMIDIANKTHLYFGLYDGRVRPSDGEAQGVLWYKMDTLKKEMEKFPDLFTQDLHMMMDKYKTELNKFRDFTMGQ